MLAAIRRHWKHVWPFGCISDSLCLSGVCVILIQYWGLLSPAGFSTKQRLGGICSLVYHLNECQRSTSGQMEAEQMEPLAASITAKTPSHGQTCTVVAKCPLDAPRHLPLIKTHHV